MPKALPEIPMSQAGRIKWVAEILYPQGRWRAEIARAHRGPWTRAGDCAGREDVFQSDGPIPVTTLQKGLLQMNFMTTTAIFDAATQREPIVDRGGDTWTEEQVLLLASLVRVEHLSNASVAVRMGRTESSIATAISRYAVRDPRAQLRTCLPCARKFFSMHVGNRVCARCVQRNRLECA